MISPFEIQSGSHVFDGVNKGNWAEEDLARATTAVVSKELDQGHVRLSTPHAEQGRGLLAARAFKEGDKITDVACLWFDTEDVFQAHLRAHPIFRDRTIMIPGVLHPTKGRVRIYGCMVGVGQYVQHFVGIRGKANATFAFDPTMGFNFGKLEAHHENT